LPLIEGLEAENLIADKAFDTDAIVACVEAKGMNAVIPPRKNRKEQREYDAHLYKLRHIIENTFLKFKQWRGIATRYCKRVSSFLAFVQIRCLMIWTQIS